jgi:cytochrome c oxidase cbb3-type subunit I/II
MGRDLYVREGCYTCHSQMIRPLVPEVLRYGKPSEAVESMHDHPFQWGSRRVGPDLARVGGRYPDVWHYRHLAEPRDLVAQSIMPAYPWLLRDKLDFAGIRRRVSAMRTLGVPYSVDQVEGAEAEARAQAQAIARELIAEGAPADVGEREIVALIAYLQGLGKNVPEEKPQ